MMGCERRESLRNDDKLLDFHDAPVWAQDLSVILLAQEFYGHKSIEEGVSIFGESITSGEQHAKVIIKDDELIGVGTYKIYEWSKIENQLYLEPGYDVYGRTVRFRLAKFGDLVDKVVGTRLFDRAGELAYVVVNPKFRGFGYGKRLFNARIGELKKISDSLIFAIARGIYAQTDINQLLTQAMLSSEEEVNGRMGDGRVCVRGIWSDVEWLSSRIGYDLSGVDFSSGAGATIHQAAKVGFVPIGFSRNVSPTWVCRADRVVV